MCFVGVTAVLLFQFDNAETLIYEYVKEVCIIAYTGSNKCPTYLLFSLIQCVTKNTLGPANKKVF